MKFLNEFEQIDFPKLGYIRVPKLPIAKSEIKRLNLPPNYSNEDYLACIVKEGFDAKIKSGEIPKDKLSEYWERLDFELTEITKLLFTDYILLVYNLIQFCDNNGILNSPSRGSCGGSLLLYVIGVHKLDSLRFGLLFERFISATRAEVKEFDGQKYIGSSSLADIDIDSDANQKHRLNEYINSAFPERSAAILTFGTFQSKVAIKEVLKCVENVDESEATRVSNFIQSNFGKVESIKESLEKNEDFKNWAKDHKNTVKIAQKINFLIKSKSVHASGIILCENPLLDTMPVELTRDKKLVTGFSMEYAQMLGIKLDNLGLKNLSAIDECFKLIGKKFKDIDVNDPSIYQYLNLKDEFYGIFQAEEGLGKMVMQKLQCKNIDDIGISIALGRPGCMRFVDEISKARQDGEIRQIDERIKDILSPTYNVIIFQEQIMALSRRMADFTGSEADGLRKGIGKKIKEKVLQYKDKFISGAIKNGYNQELVLELWNTFEASGDYLFNRCLSPDTVVESEDGYRMMFEIKVGDKIKSHDIKKDKDVFVNVSNIYSNRVEIYEIELDDGRKIKASLKHKFLCEDKKMRTLEDILIKKSKILTD